MAELPGAERKQVALPSLDGGAPFEERGQPSILARSLVITIIGCRKHLLDGDNFIAGAKALRDSIAGYLGVDDGDPRLTWEYAQVKSQTEGTLVLISLQSCNKNHHPGS